MGRLILAKAPLIAGEALAREGVLAQAQALLRSLPRSPDHPQQQQSLPAMSPLALPLPLAGPAASASSGATTASAATSSTSGPSPLKLPSPATTTTTTTAGAEAPATALAMALSAELAAAAAAFVGEAAAAEQALLDEEDGVDEGEEGEGDDDPMKELLAASPSLSASFSSSLGSSSTGGGMGRRRRGSSLGSALEGLTKAALALHEHGRVETAAVAEAVAAALARYRGRTVGGGRGKDGRDVVVMGGTMPPRVSSRAAAGGGGGGGRGEQVLAVLGEAWEAATASVEGSSQRGCRAALGAVCWLLTRHRGGGLSNYELLTSGVVPRLLAYLTAADLGPGEEGPVKAMVEADKEGTRRGRRRRKRLGVGWPVPEEEDEDEDEDDDWEENEDGDLSAAELWELALLLLRRRRAALLGRLLLEARAEPPSSLSRSSPSLPPPQQHAGESALQLLVRQLQACLEASDRFGPIARTATANNNNCSSSSSPLGVLGRPVRLRLRCAEAAADEEVRDTPTPTRGHVWLGWFQTTVHSLLTHTPSFELTPLHSLSHLHATHTNHSPLSHVHTTHTPFFLPS